MTSSGFVRGQLNQFVVVRGNAVQKVDVHAEHAQAHEHEHGFAHDIDIGANFAEVAALVQQAAGSPVNTAMAALEARFSADALSAAAKAGAKRDAQAKRAAEEAMQNKTSKEEIAHAEAELASAVAQLEAIRKLRHRA